MSLRNYLKGIADALRDNGAYSDQEDGKINAQEFSSKIYEVVDFKYSAGMVEGYNRGQEVGYENGHEEGYHQGEAEGYKQGGLDASPQETVSGEAICITDISPIEHNMGVKISGVEDISTVKLYKQGKNLLNEKAVAPIVINADGWERYGWDLGVLPQGNYKMTVYGNYTNAKPISYKTITDGVHGAFGTLYENNKSQTIVLNGSQGLIVYLYQGVTDLYDNVTLQLEVGDKTEYEPYIEPTVYDVQSDGTVEGVTSLYPSTTLYTDTNGAVIDCTYYQDGKKVKENLTNKVSSIESVTEEVTE